mgnify:CR=1 FL=1
MTDLVVLEPQTTTLEETSITPKQAVAEIASSWKKTTESLLLTAIKVRQYADAFKGTKKKEDEFKSLLEKLGIGESTYDKLHTIGGCKRWINTDKGTIIKDKITALPASYNYLCSLAARDEDEYDKIYTKLTDGEEYQEAIKVLKSKRGNKNKRQRVLFTFFAEPEKLNSADKAAIERFVESYERRSIIKISKKPAYKQLFADDAE